MLELPTRLKKGAQRQQLTLVAPGHRRGSQWLRDTPGTYNEPVRHTAQRYVAVPRERFQRLSGVHVDLQGVYVDSRLQVLPAMC